MSEIEDRSTAPTRPTRWQTARAYAVHVYTASGVVFAFLAAAELCLVEPDPRWVFAWLVAAVLVDATDGPLARVWQVETFASRIQGRTIDDIVDYLTFTFLPLVLVWRMDWLAGPAGLWVCLAMVASLLGFANTHAKLEGEGFFLGFPSYWNVYAFYAGLWAYHDGHLAATVVLLGLTALTVAPVRFLYPNLAPPPWRWPVLVGAALWLGLLLALLPYYPAVPAWLVWISLLYPVGYALLSFALSPPWR